MRHRLKAAVAAATITAASLVAAPPADASGGYITAGTAYGDYGPSGNTKGMFFYNQGDCDSLGYVVRFDTAGSWWSTNLSEISVTGNQGCDGIRVYQRTNPAVYWTCLSCKGTVIRLAPPFNDNVSKARYFHVTGVVQ